MSLQSDVGHLYFVCFCEDVSDVEICTFEPSFAVVAIIITVDKINANPSRSIN